VFLCCFRVFECFCAVFGLFRVLCFALFYTKI
jgi:hypothetical protein